MIDRFALIIGAMKCGTTSLFTYLSRHPEVAPSREKEPDFFSHDAKWSQGFDWYHALWDFDSDVHRVALEASTCYTKIPEFPDAAQRIAGVRADLRFIYILRDPIERIESHYRHHVLHGTEQGKRPIDKAITPDMIAISKYAMQIAEYYRRFPANRVLLLAFEDLRSDPRALLERVCRFLEIDPAWEFRGLETAHHPSDHAIYRFLERVPGLPAVVKMFPVRYRQVIRMRLARRFSRGARLSAGHRDRIRAELRDDMRRLHEEFGFDTSRWQSDND